MPNERLTLIRYGALTLWGLAVLTALFALVNDARLLMGLALLFAIGALALDLRYYTVTAVHRMTRTLGLFYDDVEAPGR